ncbi:uncharacterized protein SCHCODRAFT_01194083 [Schizophyllum commune H4-8]|nr:uncharacterized protein SCHCODRAFT_01194083 [Schizophyllum commune H4-8]KAI5885311.1 hypothetical protein SCHCODRAFT_01194083 [Schizophyllum commune H4-8]
MRIYCYFPQWFRRFILKDIVCLIASANVGLEARVLPRISRWLFRRVRVFSLAVKRTLPSPSSLSSPSTAASHFSASSTSSTSPPSLSSPTSSSSSSTSPPPPRPDDPAVIIRLPTTHMSSALPAGDAPGLPALLPPTC